MVFSVLMTSGAARGEDRVQVRLRQMLNLPSDHPGKVTLDLKSVTLAAMTRSDSFRAIVSKYIAVETDVLEQRALTDSFVFIQARQEWNRNQPNSLFGTNRFNQTSVDLGIEKKLASGTRMNLGLSEFRNDSEFGSFGNINTKVAGGRLTLSQSLWRDAFGVSTRDLIGSGQSKSRAKKLQLESEIEEWFMQLSELFHQVWLTQRRIDAIRESLERKDRLASLFDRRQQLGISEETDRIQIESAVNQTRVQLDEHERILKKQWNLLVVSLKLEREDRETDPMTIPISLGEELTQPDPTCSMRDGISRQIRQIEEELESINLLAKVALDQSRPDLSLDLGVATNGSILNSGDDPGQRWSNTFSLRNPAYTVGLFLRLPLESSKETAQVLSSASTRIQLEARLLDLKARTESDIQTTCAELSMLSAHQRLYASMEQDMQRRIRLEETRYRQARSSPFAVLQAGDELYGTTQSLNQTRVDRWKKHWEVRKMNGSLFESLEGWIREKTGRKFDEISMDGSMP
jgi:outer membrane protein TolC